MDPLADLLAEGDPFDVEPDRDGFTIGYDDVVAHEHADLVASSVAAVEAVPGVREVIHEDRELLLVRTEGDVTADRIETALRSFWRAAAASPPPTQEHLKALAAAAAPVLKREGFRKQALRWNRETTPGFVQVIELGRAEDGDGYVGTIDVGLHDDETARRRALGERRGFVSEPECQVRHPAGTFTLAADPTSLLHRLETDVLPLLARTRSRVDVLADEALCARCNPIDRAIMLVLEGQRSAAQAILQERFERLRFARAHLHDVVDRCGLDPLETGVGPERSRAEDEVLPAWVAGEAEALDHLRRAVSVAGSDARFLDGSLASLDPLHRAWRPLVASAQAAGTAEASALMALPTGPWSRYEFAPPADPRPTPAAQRLTEGLACYLMAILRSRVPTLEWRLVETSSGLEPAVAGLPFGPVHVVKVSIDLLDGALRPLTQEQERLFRRYNPLRADVERWLQGAPPPPRAGRGFLDRFRRG